MADSGFQMAVEGEKLKVTYLPKGYLVVASTYLYSATVHQASLMVSFPVALTRKTG